MLSEPLRHGVSPTQRLDKSRVESTPTRESCMKSMFGFVINAPASSPYSRVFVSLCRCLPFSVGGRCNSSDSFDFHSGLLAHCCACLFSCNFVPRIPLNPLDRPLMSSSKYAHDPSIIYGLDLYAFVVAGMCCWCTCTLRRPGVFILFGPCR